MVVKIKTKEQKKCAIEREIKLKNYKDCLFKNEIKLKPQQRSGADLGYVESVGLTNISFLCIIYIDYRNKCVITIKFSKGIIILAVSTFPTIIF